MDKKEKILHSPLTILRSEAVFLALQKLWINNHLNVKDPEKLVGDFFVYLASLKNEVEVNPRKIRDFYGQLLKENTLGEINQDFRQDMLAELIEKELDASETVLDFGCGKLTFLKNIAAQNKNIKKLIGVDSKSQPVLADLDPRISFERSLDNIPENSVDLAIIKLVLHHIASDEEIMEILKNIKKVLRPGGKLIIFEESFPEEHCHSGLDLESSRVSLDCALDSRFHGNDKTIQETKEYLEKFQLQSAEVATADFLKLTKEEKMQYLFLNDWLMNLQNKYMPWAWQYKSMEEWAELVELAGFKKLESHFIGAIEKRKRKQGMTSMLTFSVHF